MTILTSYHTHTTWSDGRFALAAMVRAAADAGLHELGISDHLAVLPVGAPPAAWSIPVDAVPAYRRAVRQAAARAPMRVRLGLEVDYVPAAADTLRAVLGANPTEYRIGSVHVVDGLVIDGDPSPWRTLGPDGVNHVWRRYWAIVAEMASSGLFAIAGHLDLPKKFGYRPSADLRPLVARALQAVAASGMTVELNTSGWDRPCGEPYPDTDILAMCRDLSIPVLVTADAHAPDEITRHYDRARRHLRLLGLTPPPTLDEILARWRAAAGGAVPARPF